MGYKERTSHQGEARGIGPRRYDPGRSRISINHRFKYLESLKFSLAPVYRAMLTLLIISAL